MLAAMRPNDSRYASVPLPAGSPQLDATVRAVAMSWPVINPLSRYRNAQKLAKGPNPPAFSIGMKEKHDAYWKTEDAMREGNPMLLLERGEKVQMPAALWVQGRSDIVHDYHDDDSNFPGNEPERFVWNSRKAGGDIEIVYSTTKSARPAPRSTRSLPFPQAPGSIALPKFLPLPAPGERGLSREPIAKHLILRVFGDG